MGTGADDIIEELFARARDDEHARLVAPIFADAWAQEAFAAKEIEPRLDALVGERANETPGAAR